MIPPKDAIEKPAILNTTRIAATPVTTTICLTCSADKLNFTSGTVSIKGNGLIVISMISESSASNNLSSSLITLQIIENHIVIDRKSVV